MLDERKVRETVEFANKLISAAREECAEIAEAVGAEYGEPAIGHAIAKKIRGLTK